MSIEPATVKSLNLKIAAKMNFSFQSRNPSAAIGAQSLRRMSRRVVGGLTGEYWYSGSSASRGAYGSMLMRSE